MPLGSELLSLIKHAGILEGILEIRQVMEIKLTPLLVGRSFKF
jgi:hypothetical protein